jgi:preprotein translocase subunit SecE
MSKLTDYVQDSTHELVNNVSWPTWEELQQSVIIVVIATALITALVYLMDLAFSGVLGGFYNILQ